MLRRHPDGWGASRQALFALVPVLIGAAVVITGGDGPSAGVNRIEATRSTVAPAPESAAVAPSPIEPAAVAAAVESAGDPAAAVAAESLPGSPAPADPGAAPTDAVPGELGPAPAAATAESTPATSPAPAPDSTVPTTAPAPAPSTTSTTTTTTAPPAPPAPAGRSPNPSAAAEVVPLTNADRSGAGLGTLSRNGCLDAAASGFAEQMARNGVLAHNSGAGAAVTECRPGATWGDNVGRAVPCDTALLERQWMASPSHRRNILTSAFAFIGVGAWTGDDGTCWVQVLFSS